MAATSRISTNPLAIRVKGAGRDPRTGWRASNDSGASVGGV
jgi:hypothetical protein